MFMIWYMLMGQEQIIKKWTQYNEIFVKSISMCPENNVCKEADKIVVEL